jgi:hypothetical protein
MSSLPFWRDPVFWVALAILSAYSLAGFMSTLRNGRATPGQMRRNGQPKGLAWTAHFGFWDVTLVVHPVLAWTTAKMWPLWETHGAAIALCIIGAGSIGYLLQSGWSRGAGSSDAWSEGGHPNDAGIIHIQHMGVELGILLMLIVSAVRYGEVPVSMFVGVAAIMVNHFLLGAHWPLKAWFHDWRPADMTGTLDRQATYRVVGATIILLFVGFTSLSLS